MNCLKCNIEIINPRKGLKFCCSKCRVAFNSYKSRVKQGLIKNPGVGSGGNQIGNNNHQYKTGIGIYNKLAFSSKPHLCERCESTENLLTHHRDHNRKNNSLENLEILCKKCHQKHHEKRDSTGKYTK